MHNNMSVLPTLLTQCPREVLRTGALERAVSWDQSADASVLTRVRLTWICVFARRVDGNCNTQMNKPTIRV